MHPQLSVKFKQTWGLGSCNPANFENASFNRYQGWLPIKEQNLRELGRNPVVEKVLFHGYYKLHGCWRQVSNVLTVYGLECEFDADTIEPCISTFAHFVAEIDEAENMEDFSVTALRCL